MYFLVGGGFWQLSKLLQCTIKYHEPLHRIRVKTNYSVSKGKWNIVLSMSLCSSRPSIARIFRNRIADLHQFLGACYLWLWLEVCQVLSVSWMTAWLHIMDRNRQCEKAYTQSHSPGSRTRHCRIYSEWSNVGLGCITGLGQSLLSMTALFNVTPPPTGKRSILMSVSVFLSVRDHIFRTIHPIFTKLFVDVTYGHTYDIHMAVAQSSSGSLVICYVFPVSWLTSYLHIS